MKKIIFSLFCFFVCISLFGQPTSIFPTLDENPTWYRKSCFFCGGISPFESLDTVKYAGTSIRCDGIEYINLVNESENDTVGWIRQEGNKVYAVRNVYSLDCEENLMLDFDLNVGDSFSSDFYYRNELFVQAIIVKEVFGIPRRHFLMHYVDPFSETGSSLSTIWIEGIGNLYAPIPPWLCSDFNQCANGGETSVEWIKFELDNEFLAHFSYNFTNNYYSEIEAISPLTDVSIAGGALGPTNFGVLWLTQENTGDGMIDDSQISLELPPGILFSNSEPMPTDQTSNTLIWDMGSYELMEHEQIKLEVEILETADIDPNGLFYFATVGDCSNESGSNSKFASFSTSVNESTELNDIVAIPRGASDDNYIFIEQPITYTIRFQNTGTDTIDVVNILNPISENLDLRTFNFLAASHNYKITGVYNGNVNWEFDNIKLPPASTDFVGSQGFVQYRISAKQNLNPNTEIFNQAYITFDGDAPIETNTFKHTVSSDVTLAVDLLDFSAKWNQDNSRAIEWTLGNPLQMESVELERSINKRDFYPIKTILSPQFEEFNFNDELWEPNIDWWYRLKFVEQNGEVSYSEIIKLSDKNNSLQSELFEFDPINKQLKWSIPSEGNQTWDISIFDQLGRVIFTRTILADNNLDFHYQLPSNLNGTYFIRAKSENEIYSNRFTVFE